MSVTCLHVQEIDGQFDVILFSIDHSFSSGIETGPDVLYTYIDDPESFQ